MLAVALWMFGIAVAVSVMVITVAMELFSVQFGLGAVIATFIAIAGIRDYGDAEAHKANKTVRTAILVRHMAILWAWAAVSICIIYSTIIVWTQAWVPLFVVLILASGTCMFIANMLQTDADAGVTDERILAFVDRSVWAQFVAICLLIGGVIIVGRFGPAGYSGENKWAAMNIMLCTGLGLAIVSAFSIVNAISGRKARGGKSRLARDAGSDTPAGLPSQASRRRRPVARVV